MVHDRMLKNKLVFILLLLISGFWAFSSNAQKLEEEFSEELLLRPLPDGKVLTHFHFTNALPKLKLYRRHHRLFPKAIFQLVQKFRIQEMEISFTQGRWDYNRWGGADPMAISNAKPSGVELWAVFGVPDEEIDAAWRNLTHALSGLFCASINFLESPTMFATPVRTLRRDLNPCTAHVALDCREDEGFTFSQQQSCADDRNPGCSAQISTKNRRRLLGRVRYGALPREAVCTENLTPWLKLLPCRDKAGLSTLLDRPRIYGGFYHSLRLNVRSGEFGPRTEDSRNGTVLHQSLTVVLQPSTTVKADGTASRGNTMKMPPDWSLSSLFGKDLVGSCPLAKLSTTYLELERTVVDKLKQLSYAGRDHELTQCRASIEDVGRGQMHKTTEGLSTSAMTCFEDENKCMGSGWEFDFVDNKAYTLHLLPQRVFHEDVPGGCEGVSSILFEFVVNKSKDALPFNVGMSWKAPLKWAPLRGPFRVSRFLVGSGNAEGTIAITFKTNQQQLQRSLLNVPSYEVKSQTSDGSGSAGQIDAVIFQIVPWYVHIYFHTLQIIVDGQPRSLWEVVKWMNLSPSEDRKSPGVIEMQLELPRNSSIVALTVDFDKGFLRIDEHPPDANRGFDLPAALISFPHMQIERQYQIGSSVSFDSKDSPLLKYILEERLVQLYTEVLLVPLATPDFSMPYNVITLTCTVLALYFGSLLNVLRRRVGEEEKPRRSQEFPMIRKLKQLLHKVTGRKTDSSPKGLKFLKILFIVVIAIFVKYYIDYN